MRTFGDTELTGETIRLVRRLKGLSQHQLALCAGLTRQRVWRIENRHCTPRPDELAKLWGVLSSEPSDRLARKP